MKQYKIINDPLYGFITISDPLIIQLIDHPFFQRLKRIQQMALANLVYPGATHHRFQHSLGAFHLMQSALFNLKNKGIIISPNEELATKIAILFHDIGHGPFSHALERQLLLDISHENLSLKIMEVMNKQFDNQLDLAILIYKNKYPKLFLNQLINGQLDIDRMDYLMRDSFYTGVSEGIIGYDRILKMLNVVNNQIVVEEKGIISIENFLIARQHMYWQVYRHKTVLSSENLLVKIIQRARFLHMQNDKTILIGSILDYFLSNQHFILNENLLEKFIQLDDTDVMFAIKKWSTNVDKILSLLCKSVLQRNLYKCIIQNKTISKKLINTQNQNILQKLKIKKEDLIYFSFQNKFEHNLYKINKNPIYILYKNGQIKEISTIENSLINETVSISIKRNYYCYLNI